MNQSTTIRPYQAGDEQAAYQICMKTGDHGRDGEPFFQADPDALGRIYVGPYLRFAPELALMLEDPQGVCGYAMAVLDTRDFFARYEREWRPLLVEEFPDPSGPEASWSRVEQAYHLYHHPDYFCPDPYDEYPAHLHIDLLPRAQGQGYGRRMIEALLRLLREAGAPGVHLGMSAVNTPAFGFYQRLGFQELTRDEEAIYMGLRLADAS